MISNFAETTNVKITAIDPEKELQVCPAIVDRLVTDKKGQFLRSGEIILPEKIAKGMHIKRGDTVVLVATNKDGSVNGMQFIVSGIIQSIIGPQGKDGYITIQDARKLLRIGNTEVSEIVVRIKSFSHLKKVVKQLKMFFAPFKNKKGKPVFEVHAWSDLSPFTNIAGMIDLMTITVKIIMIAIVLISVLNVMLMSVYERVREIGTLSAMGTSPAKILLLFVSEGLALGLLGAIIGNILGLGLLFLLRVKEVTFSFGMMKNLVLRPEFNWSELVVLNLIVLFISVLASFQPAWKASRMEPAEALRQV
jgi:putative ABC transport system permease protein